MKKVLFFLAMSLFAFASTPDISELMDHAIQAQQRSYSPYSHYRVGAALITKSGKIFTGCNVENASYGVALCAERTAIFKAVSEGEKEIAAIVIVTRDGGMSCGACRQVLNEFNPEARVIAIDEQKKIHHDTTLNQVLPFAFGPANLQ